MAKRRRPAPDVGDADVEELTATNDYPTKAELEAIAANLPKWPEWEVLDDAGTPISILTPEINLAADRQLRHLRARYTHELNRAWWTLAVWLLPVVVVYAFGWSVGWIVRGFLT